MPPRERASRLPLMPREDRDGTTYSPAHGTTRIELRDSLRKAATQWSSYERRLAVCYDASVRARGILLALVLLSLPLSAQQPADRIPTPESHFGFRMGADGRLANAADIEKYFELVAAGSDRVKIVDLGPTTEGRSQICRPRHQPRRLHDEPGGEPQPGAVLLHRVAPAGLPGDAPDGHRRSAVLCPAQRRSDRRQLRSDHLARGGAAGVGDNARARTRPARRRHVQQLLRLLLSRLRGFRAARP